MAKEGDWRNNKDDELDLDGIGGVNILVKGDVHRSGSFTLCLQYQSFSNLRRNQLPVLRLREPGRDRGLCQDGQARRLPCRRSAQLRRMAH